MAKIIVSDDAAKALVKSGTTQITKSVQTVSRIQDSPSVPEKEKDNLRPAVLVSEWGQNAAGLWGASAQFIVNDVVDTSFTFPVVAPTATAKPSGTVGTARFYVVWRERWEMIAPEEEITGSKILSKIYFTSKATVDSVSKTSTTIAVPTGTASASYTPTGSVSLSLEEPTSQSSGVVVVTDIVAVNGALGVETKKITTSFLGGSATITSNVATSNQSVVTDVSSTTDSRFFSVSAW